MPPFAGTGPAEAPAFLTLSLNRKKDDTEDGPGNIF